MRHQHLGQATSTANLYACLHIMCVCLFRHVRIVQLTTRGLAVTFKSAAPYTTTHIIFTLNGTPSKDASKTVSVQMCKLFH